MKYAHFGAFPTNFTAMKVAQFFVDIIVKLYGYLSSIVTERDWIFMSQFWKNWMSWVEPSWKIVHLTTLRRMDKLR